MNVFGFMKFEFNWLRLELIVHIYVRFCKNIFEGVLYMVTFVVLRGLLRFCVIIRESTR